jgi:hypothetical protein
MLVRQRGTLRQRRGAQSGSWLGAIPNKYALTSVSIFVAIVAAVYAILFQNYRINTSTGRQYGVRSPMVAQYHPIHDEKGCLFK